MEKPEQPTSAKHGRSETPDTNGKGDGAEGSPVNNYLKELHKGIRNVTKKLAATAKVDSIIAENPNLSLDDLVQTKKINTDQKAQALKKPSLQAQLAQLEEQAALFKKFDVEYQQILLREKEQLQRKHEEELEGLRAKLKAEESETAGKDLRVKLLTLSKFLRAAATRRQSEDQGLPESKAFEGALFLLYGGDGSAVEAAEKLINGTDDKVPPVEGPPVDVTYSTIKTLSLQEVPGEDIAETATASAAISNGEAAVGDPQSDPTLANATLNEMSNGQTPPAAEPTASLPSQGPSQGAIDAGAANAAATEITDKSPGADDMADSWVSVPRDPTETEQGSATAAKNSATNWADDVPDMAEPAPKAAASADDGFHEVHHSRGGRGRGGMTGSDHRGGGRGRGGFRGDFRGHRGRGGGGRGGEGGEWRGRGRGGGRGGRGRGD